MSYNIDTWKLKKIDLILPQGFDIEKFNDRAIGQIEVNSNLKDWEYNWDGEGFQMRGEITEKGFKVLDIKCWGEGSGHDYSDLLIPLIQKFNGYLEASAIWERGDSITKFFIDKDGEHSEDIEI